MELELVLVLSSSMVLQSSIYSAMVLRFCGAMSRVKVIWSSKLQEKKNTCCTNLCAFRCLKYLFLKNYVTLSEGAVSHSSPLLITKLVLC